MKLKDFIKFTFTAKYPRVECLKGLMLQVVNCDNEPIGEFSTTSCDFHVMDCGTGTSVSNKSKENSFILHLCCLFSIFFLHSVLHHLGRKGVASCRH